MLQCSSMEASSRLGKGEGLKYDRWGGDWEELSGLGVVLLASTDPPRLELGILAGLN